MRLSQNSDGAARAVCAELAAAKAGFPRRFGHEWAFGAKAANLLSLLRGGGDLYILPSISKYILDISTMCRREMREIAFVLPFDYVIRGEESCT